MTRTHGPDDRRRQSRPAAGLGWVEALEGRQLFAANPLQAVPQVTLPLPGGGGGTGQTDNTAPTATFATATRDPTGVGYDIAVTYADDTALLDNSFDNDDLRVTGPGGYSQLARLRFTTVLNATSRTVHYLVSNPTTFGVYAVSVQAREVGDTSLNTVPAGVIGSFVAGVRPGGGGGGTPTNFTPPDLVVTLIKAPTQAATLGQTTIVARVSNLGNTGTGGRTDVRVLLSQTGVIDSTAIVADTQSVPAIAAGESRRVTLKFDTPDVVSGGYFFAIQVDPNNTVTERTETNNVALTPAPVAVSTPFVDLAPAFLTTPPATVVGGAAGGAAIRITNNGTAAFNRTANVVFYASADAALDTNDSQITSLANLPLRVAANGGTRDVRAKFNYPAGIAEGNYFILARVDTDNTVPDADLSNNTAASASTVLIRPPFVDLKGDSIQVIDGPLGAGTNRVDVTVGNLGNVSADGNLTIALSASPINTPGGGDTQLALVTRPVKIKSLGSQTLRLTFSLPPTLARGNYFLHAAIDPAPFQQFTERDETNNDVFTINPYQTP